MNLILTRTYKSSTATLGQIYIGVDLICSTLEQVDRQLEDGGEKIDGLTCIPRGTYVLDFTYSPKFNMKLPLLINVPNFINIRIHPGNTAADTEGCILVGTKMDIKREMVLNSRLALNYLLEQFDWNKDNYIEIK
jgi:hypothetical protein